MSIGLSAPWALILGITALIPLLKRGQAAISYPSISMLPSDPLSTMLDRLLRSSAAAAALSLSLGSAGPYLHEQWVERVGTGAHIVLLLDRSSSMNENFSGSYMGGRAQETKGAIARKLLAEFVARREHDLFAMIDFSAAPIYVMPFTQDRPAILAAIEATSGRGHGVTNIAPGLAMALDFYSGKPFTGSRIVCWSRTERRASKRKPATSYGNGFRKRRRPFTGFTSEIQGADAFRRSRSIRAKARRRNIFYINISKTLASPIGLSRRKIRKRCSAQF